MGFSRGLWRLWAKRLDPRGTGMGGEGFCLRHQVTWLAMSLGILAAFAGCRWQPVYPPTTPVTLTITYRGEPVEGATVVLIPEDRKQPVARGLTDGTGVAKPRSFPEVPGVLPGRYTVVVHKRKIEALPPAESSPQSAPQITFVDLLPPKYAEKDQSGLQLEVPPTGSIAQHFALSD